MDGPARALALCVEPDDDSLLIGSRDWPNSVDRRSPGLPFWPSGTYATVALRLPKARDELAMLTEAGAGALKPGGTFYLFGGNDEGIASAGRVLGEVFDTVDVVLAKFHARVHAARRPKRGLRTKLADWRGSFTFQMDGETFAHTTYPGVFASGRLDEATRLLLENLPEIAGRVLDFACGSGAIAQVLTRRQPKAQFALADIDAVALEAAKENVQDAMHLQIATVDDIEEPAFDTIVSNPPIHAGGARSLAVLEDLFANAPLAAGGKMFLVVQRTIPVTRLATGFTCSKLAENASFTVWALHR